MHFYLYLSRLASKIFPGHTTSLFTDYLPFYLLEKLLARSLTPYLPNSYKVTSATLPLPHHCRSEWCVTSALFSGSRMGEGSFGCNGLFPSNCQWLLPVSYQWGPKTCRQMMFRTNRIFLHRSCQSCQSVVTNLPILSECCY